MNASRLQLGMLMMETCFFSAVPHPSPPPASCCPAGLSVCNNSRRCSSISCINTLQGVPPALDLIPGQRRLLTGSGSPLSPLSYRPRGSSVSGSPTTTGLTFLHTTWHSWWTGSFGPKAATAHSSRFSFRRVPAPTAARPGGVVGWMGPCFALLTSASPSWRAWWA